MIIMHITKKYPNMRGGDAYMVHNLAKLQKKMGHGVVVLASRSPEIIRASNIKTVGFAVQNLDKISVLRVLSLLFSVPAIFKHIKTFSPDIIHVHSVDLGMIASVAAKLRQTPVVITCHGVAFPYKEWSKTRKLVEILLLKAARYKRIITVDPSALEAFKKHKMTNVKYIPNGVDTALYAVPRRGNKKIVTILFVGRLERQKGLHVLIEALSGLRAENYKTVIVGDGCMKNQLERMVRKHGLNGRVFFLGNVSNGELRRLYAESDIFVLPSTWEGFPLVLLEAWAASLPVVVTNVGALVHVCKNEKNALVVQQGDAAALRQALALLIKNKELRDKLGSAGRETAATYTWDKIARLYMATYKEVLGHG